MNEDHHQIGEVADVVGLSLRTIRHYEEVGLVLPSARSAGGFRLYTDDDIERLRLVKHMKPLDFSLDEMRNLLELRDRLAGGVSDEDERSQLQQRLEMYAVAADQRCEVLRSQLASAEGMAAMLRKEARQRSSSRQRR